MTLTIFKMKKFRLVFSLAALLLLIGCSKDTPPRAQLLVTVTGECVCNVFLYNQSGLCLQSRIWDCGETKILTFDVYQEDEISVVAEIRGVSVSFGRVYEIGLIF